MAKKSVTVRLNDDVIELVNQQVGDTFTQKFENLVTRCVWELPEKEKCLKEIDRDISRKRDELASLGVKAIGYDRALENIRLGILQLGRALDVASDVEHKNFSGRSVKERTA